MKAKKNRKHLALIGAMDCCACGQTGPSECHHIRDGIGMAQKASDEETIPLCYYHHRGGQGFHTLGKRAWEAIYGTQRALLARTLKLIEMKKKGL